MTRLDVLPSALCTASAPRIGLFRGSMAGLCAPLSTLRRNPREQLRMTRGRCGSLLLHRERLALSTPCRSPGASQIWSASPQIPEILTQVDVDAFGADCPAAITSRPVAIVKAQPCPGHAMQAAFPN